MLLGLGATQFGLGPSLLRFGAFLIGRHQRPASVPDPKPLPGICEVRPFPVAELDPQFRDLEAGTRVGHQRLVLSFNQFVHLQDVLEGIENRVVLRLDDSLVDVELPEVRRPVAFFFPRARDELDRDHRWNQFLPQHVRTPEFPSERPRDIRNVVPVRRSATGQTRLHELPVDAAVHADVVVALGEHFVEERDEGTAEKPPLNRLIGVFHGQAVRAGEVEVREILGPFLSRQIEVREQFRSFLRRFEPRPRRAYCRHVLPLRKLSRQYTRTPHLFWKRRFGQLLADCGLRHVRRKVQRNEPFRVGDRLACRLPHGDLLHSLRS